MPVPDARILPRNTDWGQISNINDPIPIDWGGGNGTGRSPMSGGVNLPPGIQTLSGGTGQTPRWTVQGAQGGTGGANEGDGFLFNDPISQQYEGRVNSSWDTLQQAPAYGGDAWGMLAQAAQSDPRTAGILSQFQSAIQGGQQQNAASIAGLEGRLNPRIDQLYNTPVWNDTENAARRAQTFDTFERERQQAIQQTTQRLMAQGHAPTSGTISQAVKEINNQYDALKSGMSRDLLLEGVNLNEQRRQTGDTLALALQAAQSNPAMLSAILTGLAQQGGVVAGDRANMVAGAQAAGGFANAAEGNRISRILAGLQVAGSLPALQNENIRLATELFPASQIAF